MAIDWAPSLVKSVGFKLLNAVLEYVREDLLGTDRYRLFADMVAHASDEEMALEHTQWRIWRLLLIRFHLSEVADVMAWVALISRFDARGHQAPSMPSTDTIRGINCRGLGTSASGYVNMDLAGCQTRFFAVPDYTAPCGIYSAG